VPPIHFDMSQTQILLMPSLLLLFILCLGHGTYVAGIIGAFYIYVSEKI
jgi:hypothetical protein